MHIAKKPFSRSRRAAIAGIGAGIGLQAFPFLVSAQNKTLVAASGIDAYFTAFPMARDRQIFEKLGLDYTYRSFDDGAVAADALLTNNADVAAASATSAMSRWDKGGKLYCVGSMATSSILYAIAVNSKINSPQDLLGKTIAAPKFTSAQLFYETYLKKHNLDRSKITLKSIPAPETVAAMERGDIDGFFLWEPWPSRAVSLVKGAKILGTADQIGFSVTSYFYYSEAMVKDKARATLAMKGLIEAVDYCQKNQAEAAKVAEKAYRLSPEDAIRFIKALDFKVAINKQAIVDDFTVNGNFAIESGIIKKLPDWNEFFHPEFVKAVAPDRATGW